MISGKMGITLHRRTGIEYEYGKTRSDLFAINLEVEEERFSEAIGISSVSSSGSPAKTPTAHGR